MAQKKKLQELVKAFQKWFCARFLQLSMRDKQKACKDKRSLNHGPLAQAKRGQDAFRPHDRFGGRSRSVPRNRGSLFINNLK